MKFVDVDHRAEVELLETVAWYEERQPGVGLRFSSDVEAVVASLATRQLMPLKVFAARGVKFVEVGQPWPFRIIVVEGPVSRRVIAFEHHRRRPGYWLDRLD